MRKLITRRALLAIALWLAFLAPAVAQFGHPIGQTSYPATSGGGGTIALVHSAGSQGSGSATSQPQTITATTAGNGVVVGVGYCYNNGCSAGGTDEVSGVTVGSQNCAEVAGTFQQGGGGGFLFATEIWVCPGVSSGDTTVTATMSTAEFYIAVAASEWSGMAASSPADGSTANIANNGTTSTLSISTNGNTSVSGDLIYSFGASQVGTLTPSATIINSITASANDQYQIAGAPGSYTNAWTGGTGSNGGSLAAFKP